LDPDPDDPRLASIGSALAAWTSAGLLTVAVRRDGPAPLLVGTVREQLRPSGQGLWALRLQVPRLERACLELGIYVPGAERPEPRWVWRGPAMRPAPPEPPPIEVAPPQPIATGERAERHAVTCWSPARPHALVLCADGEDVPRLAAWVAAAHVPVALVGIASAARIVPYGEFDTYEQRADPRACAYLPEVDPTYFADHMAYVTGTVLPWARDRLGQLPALAFGVSNGAVWAASAGVLHPELFAGVVAFSLGTAPPPAAAGAIPPHALVAGRLEPDFDRVTTLYARDLRSRGVPVRLRRPTRGHDSSMWVEELAPALRWALQR
ncbi:MAG TPA: alpha/beta hydrolase-fold protein, partial [Gaiellaceae bacterium]|nr:alpha/beta hydrolase-fold protein [Gaiellaceae bacterium]